MPAITAPVIHSTKMKMNITDEGIGGNLASDVTVKYERSYPIPDVLGYIQNRTELTRSTIWKILEVSGRIDDLPRNPQLFMDYAVSAIKRVLYALMIDGIKYQRIGNEEYEMRLFAAQELEMYLNDYTFKVSDSNKTIYEEFVPLDSEFVTSLFCIPSVQHLSFL